MSSTSATFHAETMCRRESGFVRIDSMTFEIWSTRRPSGVGHERHWCP
jgi:hypothetical protein